MASLKEVKNRIASVNNTRKITSAMKMVASSKLHRAQQSIENMRPYESRLDNIMSTFVGSLEGEISSAYAEKREVKKVAIVLLTSNSSLCGGFNANAIKALKKKIESYKLKGVEVVKIIPLGKKGLDATKKIWDNGLPDYSKLMDHPSYSSTMNISAELMNMYCDGEIDKVDLIYHHFKSSASQILTEETYLPIELKNNGAGATPNYIVEPSVEAIVEELIPKVLHLKLYTALLDSLASEHAARVIAMQIATDNADELLQELTLTYNKTRQQAITTELLDIVGGQMR